MKTLGQYKEEVKGLMAKVADIDAQAMNESRDLTADEIAVKEELMDGVDERNKIIANMERQENLRAYLETPAEPPATKPAPVNQPSGIQVGVDRASKEKFASFGQQLTAVMNAARPGGHVDPRLFNATGLGESIPSDGGFLVQTDFAATMLNDVFTTGILASRCQEVTISGNSNSIKINGIDETSRVAGSRYGGIRGYWKDEAALKVASKPTFRQIELNLKKLIGLCYATDELLQDSAALEGIIRQGFVSEFGFLLDDAIVNGTGAGQPLGILNAPCLVSVAKEAGQGADTIMFENIIKMYSRLFAASRANSVWMINQNVEPQLFSMSMAVGTGGVPVYMPAGGISGLPYGTLFGRPVLPIEQCQTLGDKGDIYLADFGGYLLARKGGMESAMSIHVNFLFDESVFRFVMRVDGQPVRATALTPFKGGANFTQSHFITLDAR